MAQTINTGFRSQITSSGLNDKIATLLGTNGVLKGFNIVAGSKKTLSLQKSQDTINTLIIRGAIITEDTDLNNTITIPDNTSGATKTYIVYAKYNHGVDSACTYGVYEGVSLPDNKYCKLGEIIVPSGFTSSSQCTIKTVEKSLTMISNQVEAQAKLIREMSPSGFTKLSSLDYDYMETTPNTIRLKDESIAYINGYRVYIPASTDIKLPDPPTTSSRTDIVFVEVWLDKDTSLPNFAVRVVSGASSLTSVKAKGQLTTESSTNFVKSSIDSGLYEATVSGASVDNKVYAIPMFTVYRRNSGGFSAKNVSGSLLSSDGVAGRKFIRDGFAYKSDGTKVLANQPRLEQGAFGGSDKALMIEEGTTNLANKKFSSPNSKLTTLFSGSATIEYDATAENPIKGRIGAEKVTTTNGGEIIIYEVAGGLNEGGKVSYSLYVKGSGTVTLGMHQANDGTGKATTILGKRITLTENYQRITVSGELVPNSLYGYNAVIRLSSNTTVWFDAFQVEKKPYATSFVDDTRASEFLHIPTAPFEVLNKSDITFEFILKKLPYNHHYSDDIWLLKSDDTIPNIHFKGSLWWVENSGSNHDIRFYTSGGNSTVIRSTLTNITKNFHYLAFVMDKNENLKKVYYDGALVGTARISPNEYFHMKNLRLHRSNSLIADFRISNKARTAEEIQQAYASNAPLPVDEYTTYKLDFDNELLLPSSDILPYPKSVDKDNKRVTFYFPQTYLDKVKDSKSLTVFKNENKVAGKIIDIVNNDVTVELSENTDNLNMTLYQRPDEQYADIVYETDIQDLRNTVSLTGFDYKQLAESQFKEVMIGGVRKTIKEYIGRWKQFGVTGVVKSDNTGFNNPVGVAVDSQGYIYVADRYNHRLVKLNPDLTYNSQFGVTGVTKSDNAGFNGPAGVALDSQGYIYVADLNNHRLVKLNPDLTYNSQFGITEQPKSDNTGLNRPFGVALDSQGYIYVADLNNHRLVKLNPDLTYNSQFGVTGVTKSDNARFNGPAGVALDSQGYIYVADSGNNRLVKLNPDLTYNSYYNTGLSYPRAVAVDENDNIYIYQSTKLIKLNSNMEYVGEIFNSKVKYGLNLGSNNYWVAVSFVVKNNNIIIPDSHNHRLIKITNVPDDIWYDANTKYPTVVLGNQDCDGIKTSFSDAPHYNYNTVSVPVSGNIPSYVTRNVAGANWASGNTIKIKALRSKDRIIGTLNPDSAKAKILSINGSTIYLNNVSGIAVNDTVSYFKSDLTLGGTTTVTAVNTTNNTITLNTAITTDYLNGYIFETTVGSSLPLVQFFNSNTKAWENVAGNWTNLGTNEATFTLGTNANLTNQDIKISYNIVSVGGEGLALTPREVIKSEADGVELWRTVGGFNNPYGVAVDSQGYIYVADYINHRLVKLNPDLTYNSQFGVTGVVKSDNTGFNNPCGVTLDSQGYIYVADKNNHRLVKLNPDLTYNSQFGITGVPKSDNTGFDHPHGVTLDSQGYIYVSDYPNHRIVKLNPDLTYNSQFGITGVIKKDNTGFNHPVGVAIDSQGYIYVADTDNHRLVKLNPDLTYNSQFGVTGVAKSDNTRFNWPVGVAIDSQGYIYVTDFGNHRLVKLNPDLTYNSQFGVTGQPKSDNTGFNNPRGVAIDSQGYIYVADRYNNRIVKMHPNHIAITDLSRKSITSLTPVVPEAMWKQFGVTGVAKSDNTGLNTPHGVAVDSQGYIYVADYINHRLVKLNPDLTYNSQFGVTGVVKSDNTGFSRPHGVAVDSQGYIYVADTNNHRLVKLNPDLTYNSQFGVTGVAKSGNTGLNHPHGVAVDSQGYIYVADKDNHRLVKLNPDLTYNSQFGVTGVAKSDNTGLKNPQGVAVDSQGYIYVTDFDNHRLVKLNPDLTFNSYYNTGLNYPRAVAVDENDNIYIYQPTKLIKLNSNMKYVEEIFNSKVKYGLNLGSKDCWVAVSFVVKNNNIIIPDRYNHRLIKASLSLCNKPILPNVAIHYTADIITPADFSTGTYDIVWKSDRIYYTANGSYDSYNSTFRNIVNKVLECSGLEQINQIYPFELSQAQLKLKLPTDIYREFIEDYNLEQISTITVENALTILSSKTLGETLPYMALLPMIIKKDGQLYLLIKGMLTKSSSMNFTSNFQLIVPINGNPIVK